MFTYYLACPKINKHVFSSCLVYESNVRTAPFYTYTNDNFFLTFFHSFVKLGSYFRTKQFPLKAFNTSWKMKERLFFRLDKE